MKIRIKRDLKYGNMYKPETYIQINKGEVFEATISNIDNGYIEIMAHGHKRYLTEKDYEILVEDNDLENKQITLETAYRRYNGSIIALLKDIDNEEAFVAQPDLRNIGKQELIDYFNYKVDSCLSSRGAAYVVNVKGVSPDYPIITNEKGAKQSDSPYRLDLVDPKALLAIGEVLKQGAEKYGEDNWKGIDLNDHLNHALVHIYAHLAGDTSDDHIGHAATRMIFALSKKLEGE